MTTKECQTWADAALAFKRKREEARDAVTLNSAIHSTKPEGASEGDLNLVISIALPMSLVEDKKEVRFTYDPLREDVACQNREALVAVLAETGMTISANDFNKWRPTKRVAGVVPGMPVRVTCVATDGNLGIFVPVSDEGHNLGSAFLGHVHRFAWGEAVGCPPVLFSLPKPDGAKPKPKRKGPAKPTRKSILASI